MYEKRTASITDRWGKISTHDVYFNNGVAHWRIEVLGPDGVIAKQLPGYEPRPQQLEMAEAVETAIAERKHCIVEAGTGTGKSLAYLIPAILSGRKTIVSTAGKALQEQIARKDIPFLQSVLPVNFTAAVLKGRANYLCRYFWLDLFAEIEESGLPEGISRNEIAALEAWLAETETGDLESLPTQLSSQLSARCTASSDTCLGRICPQHGSCFAEAAKAAAASASIVIVNHTLLTLDLVLRQNSDDMASVIPDRECVVIDEAHSLCAWATDAFTKEISRGGISRLVQDRILDSLVLPDDAATNVEYAADSFFQTLAAARPNKWSMTFALNTPSARISGAANGLVSALRNLQWEASRALLREETSENEQLRKKYLLRVEAYADIVKNIFAASEDYVVYVEIRQGARARELVYLKRTPVSVAEDLRAALFNRWPVICTSATLSTGANADFSYFKECCGVDETKFGEPLELSVGSPFDYHTNSVLYLPKDGELFDPTRYYQSGSIEYFDRLAKQIEALLLASDGRAFCLFTSNKALDEVYHRIASRLRWLVLKQGDAPRPELVARFKADGRAVLFGLKSFWEGIDVQGDALSLVIIDKLPFQPPDDPVYAARCEALNKKYCNKWAWFQRLALPEAVIALKQGFGRLIRTKSDRGVVAILDGRLTCKAYGTQVVRALPPAAQTCNMQAVELFFEQRS